MGLLIIIIIFIICFFIMMCTTDTAYEKKAKRREFIEERDKIREKKIKDGQKWEDWIRKCVRDNFEKLLYIKERSVHCDQFGKLDMDDWWEQIDHFLQTIVFPQKYRFFDSQEIIDKINFVHKYFWEYKEQYMQISPEEEQRIRECVNEHFDTLYVKKGQGIYKNEYGEVIADGWKRELEYFICNIIFPEKHLDESYMQEKWVNIVNFFDKYFIEILERKIKNNESSPSIIIHTGVDYENYVESLLLSGGFEVARTPTTGDQGVDLVAEKNGIRIAIQCKYYSKPVGNKAVQEVVAGRDFYNCQIACVVSNNSFTPSARKIANVAKVLLLNDNQIATKLNELVG